MSSDTDKSIEFFEKRILNRRLNYRSRQHRTRTKKKKHNNGTEHNICHDHNNGIENNIDHDHNNGTENSIDHDHNIDHEHTNDSDRSRSTFRSIERSFDFQIDSEENLDSPIRETGNVTNNFTEIETNQYLYPGSNVLKNELNIILYILMIRYLKYIIEQCF